MGLQQGPLYDEMMIVRRIPRLAKGRKVFCGILGRRERLVPKGYKIKMACVALCEFETLIDKEQSSLL